MKVLYVVEVFWKKNSKREDLLWLESFRHFINIQSILTTTTTKVFQPFLFQMQHDLLFWDPVYLMPLKTDKSLWMWKREFFREWNEGCGLPLVKSRLQNDYLKAFQKGKRIWKDIKFYSQNSFFCLTIEKTFQRVIYLRWIEVFFSFYRLTVQNLEQAGTVPAKVIDLGYNELFAEQGSSIEIPCIAIGLPSPKYS